MASPVGIAALIVLTSFVSEDAAALSAASLAATHSLDGTVAFFAGVFGIWIGDLGLYAMGIPLRKLAQRWAAARRLLEKGEQRAATRSELTTLSLFASRFIPGTRLPLYTAAGMTRTSFSRFAGITAIAVLLWMALLFAGIRALRSLVPLQSIAGAVVAAILLLAVGRWLFSCRQGIVLWFRKHRYWEFWPAWVFYPPVALMCVWHGMRFGGFSLPTIANPGQRNGGIVGESKYEVLAALDNAMRGFTPRAALIDAPTAPERHVQLRAAMAQLAVDYPIVLKPDVGQRGQGFKKIASATEAAKYLSRVRGRVVLQEYIPAEKELGVFYYRFPNEESGRVLSVTEKSFPAVMGNGSQTLRELIMADQRASLIADRYLERFAAAADVVVPARTMVRLVEAGNHCQGCIFADGGHLLTPALEATIDRIARALPGFFVGRFDIRYSSDQELAEGRGFKIIEVNGAASEATHIYDRRHSIFYAYKTLYRQWQIVYAIGAANRRGAHRPATPMQVLMDWLDFRKLARCYPAAD